MTYWIDAYNKITDTNDWYRFENQNIVRCSVSLIPGQCPYLLIEMLFSNGKVQQWRTATQLIMGVSDDA